MWEEGKGSGIELGQLVAEAFVGVVVLVDGAF